MVNMDSIEEVDSAEEDFSFSAAWLYFKTWMFRPLLRGLFFGVGHFLSFKLIGPTLFRSLAAKT